MGIFNRVFIKDCYVVSWSFVVVAAFKTSKHNPNSNHGSKVFRKMIV